MNTPPKLNIKAILPSLVLLGWLSYLAISFYLHLQVSQELLYGDALQYVAKAINYWDSVEKHGWLQTNPFNIAPFYRPPGIIPFVSLFPYSGDIRAFLFISVYLWIPLTIAGIYYALPHNTIISHKWYFVALCILITAMPMFYSIDIGSPSGSASHNKGMVDQLQSGLAALSIGLAIKSLRSKSTLWLCASFLIANFTLWLKPSGIAIIFIVYLFWSATYLLEYFFKDNHENFFNRKYFYSGLIVGIIFFVIFLAPCLFSEYMSKRTFEEAYKTLAFTRGLWVNVTYLDYLGRLNISLGIFLPLFMLLSLITIIKLIKFKQITDRLNEVNLLISLALAFLIWGFGIYYWEYVQEGGTIVRYFFPFILMGLVAITPVIMNALVMSKKLRLTLYVLAFIAGSNILALMSSYSPNLFWQKISGVNLSVITEQTPDLITANQFESIFHEDMKKENNYLLYERKLYFLGNDGDSIGSLGDSKSLLSKGKQGFTIGGPHDFIRGFGIRFTDIFLYFRYFQIQANSDESLGDYRDIKIVDTWQKEIYVIQHWIKEHYKDLGISKIIDIPGASGTIYSIDDWTEFRVGLENLIKTYSLREVFLTDLGKFLHSPMAYIKILQLGQDGGSITHENLQTLLATPGTKTPTIITFDANKLLAHNNAVKPNLTLKLTFLPRKSIIHLIKIGQNINNLPVSLISEAVKIVIFQGDKRIFNNLLSPLSNSFTVNLSNTSNLITIKIISESGFNAGVVKVSFLEP